MPAGNPRSPKIRKGALVKLEGELIEPVPRIIVFQYNPASMTRSLETAGEGRGGNGAPTPSTGFGPRESFDLEVELDAAEDLEQPASNPRAVVIGVADRIAALERLLHPVGSETGLLSDAASALRGESGEVERRNRVPLVLFVWGPGRVLPVRLSGFEVEEEAYTPALYPLRATVSLNLDVYTEESFQMLGRPLSQSEKLARSTLRYTQRQRATLADTNVANTVESILGIVPF